MATRGIGYLMASVRAYAGFMALMRTPSANRADLLARYYLDESAYAEVRDHWCVRLAESPSLEEEFRAAFAIARAAPSTIAPPPLPDAGPSGAAQREAAAVEQPHDHSPRLADPAPHVPLRPPPYAPPRVDHAPSADVDTTAIADESVTGAPLPFGGAASLDFLESLADPAITRVDGVNETTEVRALDELRPSTPFGETAAIAKLSVEQDASLLVELDYFSAQGPAVCRRYGLLEPQVEKLQQQWAAELRSDPSLVARLSQARASYLDYLTKRRNEQP